MGVVVGVAVGVEVMPGDGVALGSGLATIGAPASTVAVPRGTGMLEGAVVGVRDIAVGIELAWAVGITPTAGCPGVSDGSGEGV